ncbi:MAG: phosphoglucosamine mutase [Alphaproteobacteria bacterium]|nr:phosphoglucosamine mutase [Alphaproteobacteria bacterium]
MTRKYFGTDGVRGTANRHPMTADVALRLGQAAGRQFYRGDHRHRVVIGKDTRLSGYMIEPALTAGFISMGMDVILVGPMPTPAVAMLTRSMRADLGVMISASHNPYEDNGIKLFDPDGRKLSDDVERAIEERMENGVDGDLVASAKLGRAQRLDDPQGRYMEFVKATLPNRSLNGLRVVIDCAHGAAYRVAPTVLWELGAEVIPIGVNPDGFNINRNCGSTSTQTMCEQVVAHHAHMGIALDGDADRVVIADEKGHLLDGDQLMGLIAARWQREGRLTGRGVVATVMSNLGLEHYLRGLGLALHRVAVGDRYVVEGMREFGCNLGGEQSGHIVLSDFTTTGDGLIAGLQILGLVAETGRSLSEIGRCFDPVPQTLKNVRYANGSPLGNPAVLKAIGEAERRLADTGRLLIRPSGTEPVIRVMAEGTDQRLVKDAVDGVVAALERAAGAA